MNLATAYANAGKALLDLADAIDANTPHVGPASDVSVTVASFDELPPEDWPLEAGVQEHATRHEEAVKQAASDLASVRRGSASVCPAHGIEYRKGRYGPYCPSTSEDPNWSNDKGYCTVTPKSAAAWLRQHA